MAKTNDDHVETSEEREAREARQLKDKEIELKEQRRANENSFNNSALLRDIQSRQCEVLEKLGEMKVKIDNIETHTTVMNSELGSCKEDIAHAKEDIKDLKSRTVLKLSWKQVAAIITAISTILGILSWFLQHFHI